MRPADTTLPISLLVVFPLALEFATGALGFRDSLLSSELHRPAAVALQALYAWIMTFGCVGMFRSLLTRENSTLRYTWLGTLLNGPRTRPAKPVATGTPTAASTG